MLDQYILRGRHSFKPRIDDDGDWIGAEQILELNKQYWLHSKILDIGKEKLNKKYRELNCQFIPLTKEELLDIVNAGTQCVNEKKKSAVRKYFNYTPINQEEYQEIIKEIPKFNVDITKFLKNKKKTEYYYYSWW